jgi:HEAT repeat protein
MTKHRGLIMKPLLSAAIVGALAAAAPAGAQPANLENARVTAQPAASDFARQVRGLVAEAAPRWIAWTVPASDGQHQMCCWDSRGSWDDGDRWCCGRCRLERSGNVSGNRMEDRSDRSVRLEAAPEVLVLVRAESGNVSRVRAFSPDCTIDAGGMPVVWIGNVGADVSVALLESLATAQRPASGRDGDGEGNVLTSAMAAIAHHAGASADRALERLMAPAQPRSVRSKAAFWLGNARGRAGYEALRRGVPDDLDEDFRKQGTFALSQSREPEAVSTLIAMARRDASPHVRGQALFWLAQRAGRQAADAIENAILDDPDTEVKTKAVFALTQMPDGEGVPQLIHVARTNRNPEVRKKAMFWLGQSKDPRALSFFEEVLSK